MNDSKTVEADRALDPVDRQGKEPLVRNRPALRRREARVGLRPTVRQVPPEVVRRNRPRGKPENQRRENNEARPGREL